MIKLLEIEDIMVDITFLNVEKYFNVVWKNKYSSFHTQN